MVGWECGGWADWAAGCFECADILLLEGSAERLLAPGACPCGGALAEDAASA